jgi:hypothetical protein
MTLDRTAGVSIAGALNAGAERAGERQAQPIAANAEIYILAITRINWGVKTSNYKYVDFLDIIHYVLKLPTTNTLIFWTSFITCDAQGNVLRLPQSA